MSTGLVTLVATGSGSIVVTRPGSHTLTIPVTVSAPLTTPGAPTAVNATGQTSSTLTFPVTLNASGSLPASLGWRWSTDNATWTNGADITLSSPTLGQTVNETVSPLSGSWSASTLYYVQFKEQNGAGASSYCTSVTGTTSASGGTPQGQAVSTLFLTAPFSSTPYSTATLYPSGSKSAAITTRTGSAQWRAMNAATISGGPNNNNVQAPTAGAQNVWFGGWVSDALSAQTIASGTYTLTMGIYTESNHGYQLAPVLYVWRQSTDAVVGMIYDSATGLGTGATSNSATAGRVVTFTGSSVTLQAGDRLVLELYAVGSGADFVHFLYNGHTSATTDGGAADITELDFPAPIYLQPFGIIRVGPTGLVSSTGALPAVSVASDAEFRSKAMPSGYGTLWDSTQTSLKGGAGSGFFMDGSSLIDVDLMNVDTSVTFTDRDAVTRHTMHVIIRPAGGAPLSSSNDSVAASSAHPEGLFTMPPGRAITSWYQRQLYKFNPGFRLDCPNNTTSNASGFNFTQSGAYKVGPHPTNPSTRADLEISGGQTYGNEYFTGNFGAFCTTDSNYSFGLLSSIMPGWNTAGDVWELIRVMRDNGDGTATHAIYVGKLTDTTLTRVISTTRTLDTTHQSTWSAMASIGIVGKNFNRQLASTDTAPELWVSDAEFADITDPNWSWPSQIAVGDRI